MMPTHEDNLRLVRLDSTGRELKRYHTFPEIKLPADTLAISNVMVQSDLSVSPNGERIVMICKSFPYIQIFGGGDGEDIVLKGPTDLDVEIVAKETPYGSYFAQDPMVFMYESVSAGDDSFFVGYNGVEPKTEEDFGSGINSLLEFEWTGKPLRRIFFEKDIVAFDIDFKNKLIYTLENDPEPAIYRYNLPAE